MFRVDPNAMIRYALSLGNRVVAARVGLLLRAHPLLRLDDDELDRLEPLRPKSSAWLDPRDHSPGQFHMSRWNLYVPDKLAARIFRH
jgi:hypothetical protein